MPITRTEIQKGAITWEQLAGSAGLKRTQMEQAQNLEWPLLPHDWRVWDTFQALPNTPATDDLGLVAGTFGTDILTIQAGDLKAAGATTRRMARHIALPDHWDSSDGLVTLRVRAGMETTVADTTCTVDCEAYLCGTDGLVSGSDLVSTAATDMNSLSEANIDFDLTVTTLAASSRLEVRISIACNDAATGTAVTPVIYHTALLFHGRG